MSQKFKIGDVVRLKSGSPGMTVEGYDTPLSFQQAKNALTGANSPEEKIEPTIVRCRWIDSKGKQEKGRYHQDMLELVK